MIKIYGSPKSSSGRCFFTLEEVGVDYTAHPVDFKAQEHKKPDFLKLNPNGKVPAMVDGDTVIWESMAINYYLVDKFKPELLGSSAESRGHAQQWSLWGLVDLQPPLVKLLIEKFFVPAEKKNPKVVDECLENLAPMFTTLNDHLATRDYLAGNEFSIAELNLIPSLDIAPAVGASLTDYPNLLKWVGRCQERESYKKYASAE